MGVLTTVFAGVAGVGLVMRNQTRGKMARLGGWGLVLLLRLQFLSRRQRWRLLFLIDQAGETEA
jgi:hypothetical protein